MRFGVPVGVVVLLLATPMAAEPLVGLTNANSIVNFDSATPGTFTRGPIAITGLAPGYTVIAIERRLNSGLINALAFNFAAVGQELRLYTIADFDGAALAVGAPFAAPRSVGSSLSAATRFGFDIDVNDEIRVTSTGRDNFRINPSNGVPSTDTIITPAGAQAAGAAYVNNCCLTQSSTLYLIDSSTNPDQLLIMGGNPVPPGASPNGGVTTVVGSLGVDSSSNDIGFDISPSGIAYAAIPVGGVSSLYTINLATGAATLVGPFSGGTTIIGISAHTGSDLAITKSHVGAFTAGQSGTYAIVVTNNGPASASTAFVTDTLPSGMTASALSGTGWNCNISTVSCSRFDALAMGSSFPPITLTVNVSPTASGVLTNSVTVQGIAQVDSTNDTASDPTIVLPPPATHFSVTAPANATANTPINFTVTALDQFNNTAVGYTGTVQFTSSDPLATLAANSTLTNGTGTFSATLRTPGNQTITATDTVTPAIAGTTAPIAVVAPTDVSIVKSAIGTFTATLNGMYSITVSNNGPEVAAAVTVTDVLPAGATFVSATPTVGNCSGTTTVTCNLGSMASGATATIALVITPTIPGPMSNTATVSTSAQPDPNAANNSSTAAVNVLSAATIPTLDLRVLALMALILAFIALRR